MQLFIQLCSSWQDFKWHSMLHSPSANGVKVTTGEAGSQNHGLTCHCKLVQLYFNKPDAQQCQSTKGPKRNTQKSETALNQEFTLIHLAMSLSMWAIVCFLATTALSCKQQCVTQYCQRCQPQARQITIFSSQNKGRLAATLRGSRPGVQYTSLIMTSLMTS